MDRQKIMRILNEEFREESGSKLQRVADLIMTHDTPVVKVGLLLGRLAGDNEGGKGKVYHAVFEKPAKRPPCPFNDWGKKIIENDDYTVMTSLCGKKPGKRSVGWAYDKGAEINCPTCLKKLK